MQGTELVNFLVETSQLPPDSLKRELERLLRAQGFEPASVTLEDLRGVLAIYLQQILIEAKEAL